MSNKKLIEKIKKAAHADEARRRDPRYRTTMAFLIKKGFLKANANFQKAYLPKLRVKDAIWAGQNVEPRILEVLPAAMARLPRAFIFDDKRIAVLDQVVKALRAREVHGPDFHGIAYGKLRVWMGLALPDRRTKTDLERKLMRTFRLSPKTVEKIGLMKMQSGKSETEIIEGLIDEA